MDTMLTQVFSFVVGEADDPKKKQLVVDVCSNGFLKKQ
jgi:hypothetical protein